MSGARKNSSRRDKDDTNNPDVNLPGIGNYTFQKTVAIKVIDKTTLDEKKLGKLYREVRIMKLLHHPNIVKLYEVIETKSTVFLVMDYASGGELYDYLVVHGKMKEKEARAKFREILSAVNYCHKKRVIHRDLKVNMSKKAENLLLDANLNIKIADFGFSNYYDPESKLDTFCGSPPYAAPELFQGRKYTGPEVDLWSLGVILYVLTTGCLPFDGKNLQEMRESVCKGCETLLRKLLVRDPEKRHSLEILIDDPWIMESYSDSPISTDMSLKVEIDETVLKVMESKFKIDRELVIQTIKDNVYNDISAIYFMLYYDKDNKDRRASVTSNDDLDILKIASPSVTKKDSTKAPPALVMIDEDEVLPPAKVEPGQASSAKTTQAAAARRKRAQTVADGAAPIAENSEDVPPIPVTKHEKSATTRPKTSTNKPGDSEETKTPLEAEEVVARKRTNTIAGMLRGGKKEGQTDSDADNAASNDDDRPRSLRFTFNSNTTSSKPPDEIIVELIKCCNKMGLTHRLLTRYLLECSNANTKEQLKLEVEVCKLPRLNNLHGLKFKRLSGSSSDYKDTCEKILAAIAI